MFEDFETVPLRYQVAYDRSRVYWLFRLKNGDGNTDALLLVIKAMIKHGLRGRLRANSARTVSMRRIVD